MSDLQDMIRLQIRIYEKAIETLKDALVEVSDPAFQTERKDFPPTQNVGDVRDPLAKSMGDLVTPKQLGMIRALAREVKVDPDEECQAVLRCMTDELSKRAASSFIDHLKSLQGSERKTA